MTGKSENKKCGRMLVISANIGRCLMAMYLVMLTMTYGQGTGIHRLSHVLNSSCTAAGVVGTISLQASLIGQLLLYLNA